jgi:hypothetical protein
LQLVIDGRPAPHLAADVLAPRGDRDDDVTKDHLHLVQPLRMYIENQHRFGDRHVFAPRSRFLPDAILDRFERVVRPETTDGRTPQGPAVDVATKLRAMWSSAILFVPWHLG